MEHNSDPFRLAIKRGIDILAASLVLAISLPILAILVVASTLDTGHWGIFSQSRVGRNAKLFRVYKLRTMRPSNEATTHVTAAGDSRITRLGKALRGSKVDELPQFLNVLIGQMSLVGPRPDVPGYADKLQGQDRIILSVRPGITGPASVYFRDEEKLLAATADPETYNDQVLWPRKVALNRDYIEHYSLHEDFFIMIDTLLSSVHLSRAARLRHEELNAGEGSMRNGARSSRGNLHL